MLGRSWLRLLQISGAIVFVGAVAIAGWNARLTWRGGRHWTRKLWNAALVRATLIMLHVAASFGLLAMGINF